MSDMTALERGYRRILACYPRSFLRENADEVLAVLLDTAAEGQTRVGPAEAWDLVRGGVRMRLWPAAPRPRAVRAAVMLMLAGAATELATLIIVAVSFRAVRAAAAQYPASVDAVLAHQVGVMAGAPLAIALWLWMAWANGKGQDWARMLSAACFGLLTFSWLGALAQHTAADAPATTIAAAVVWAIGLASVVLIFTPAACRYYRPPLAQQ